jgi:hypothetical protein
MDHGQRRAEVKKVREEALVRKVALHGPTAKELRKNFAKTEAYVHLTLDERREVLRQVATAIGAWADARLFR